MVLELLQDMLLNNHLIAAEHKAAVTIIKQLETDEITEKNAQLRLILNPTQVETHEDFSCSSCTRCIPILFPGSECEFRTNRRVGSCRTDDVDRSSFVLRFGERVSFISSLDTREREKRMVIDVI